MKTNYVTALLKYSVIHLLKELSIFAEFDVETVGCSVALPKLNQVKKMNKQFFHLDCLNLISTKPKSPVCG
jgi:hypothetical protein